MPTFQYEAMHSNGEKVEGVLEASSKSDAVAQIRRTYDVVVKLTEIKGQKADSVGTKKVNIKAFSLMCKQFSIIMKSGLPIVQAVDLVANQTQDKELKALLEQVSQDIAGGWSMSYSFEQRGQKMLPSTFVETVKSGEESGDLIKTFERMSTYYERMTKTSTKTKSAMIYPAIVMVIAVVVVIIILTFAVPAFTKTFTELGAELPLITKILVGMSDIFQKYIVFIVLGIAAVAVGAKLYLSTPQGKLNFHILKLKMPVFGDIEVMSASSQFATTMSTMLSSGMPILQALETAAKSISNLYISGQVNSILPYVEAGNSLGSCLSECDALPDMLIKMTATGEATGSIESILDVLSEYYDNEVEVMVSRALSLIEPITICCLAVGVCFVLLSIYMPMFGMYDAI